MSFETVMQMVDELIKLDPSKVTLKKEVLLKEAKRRYPVGTKYSNVSRFTSNCKVQTELEYYYTEGCEFITDKNGGSVYYNGEWAKILETAKQKAHEYVEKLTFMQEFNELLDRFASTYDIAFPELTLGLSMEWLHGLQKKT